MRSGKALVQQYRDHIGEQKMGITIQFKSTSTTSHKGGHERTGLQEAEGIVT